MFRFCALLPLCFVLIFGISSLGVVFRLFSSSLPFGVGTFHVFSGARWMDGVVSNMVCQSKHAVLCRPFRDVVASSVGWLGYIRGFPSIPILPSSSLVVRMDWDRRCFCVADTDVSQPRSLCLLSRPLVCVLGRIIEFRGLGVNALEGMGV